MSDRATKRRNTFRFGLRNLLIASTWVCIGVGVNVVVYSFGNHDSIFLGLLGTVAYFISVGGAIAALCVRPKAGILMGAILCLAYFVMIGIIIGVFYLVEKLTN